MVILALSVRKLYYIILYDWYDVDLNLDISSDDERMIILVAKTYFALLKLSVWTRFRDFLAIMFKISAMAVVASPIDLSINAQI